MSDRLHRELGFVIPYGDSPYDDENVGEEVYIHILNHAKKYVHIMTPYLILDTEMIGALIRAAKSKPFLGICLGMQMMFEESDEVRLCKGLGLLPGRVQKIETDLKLPQIGWNSLDYHRQDPLMDGVPEGSYVYFVHTFKACPAQRSDLIATCDYNDEVPALVGRGQMYGSQFHPEKSGEIGMTILRNFAKMVGGNE